MNLQEKIFDKEIIDTGKTLLSKYLIPSLENQTNKNFSLVILINDDIEKSYIGFNLSTSFETKIIHTQELADLIKTESALCEYLITTRQDYDDCIYCNFVEDVQSFVSKSISFAVYGYVNGIKMVEESKKIYEFSCYLGSDGLIGIGLSLITKTSFNDYTTIYNEMHSHIENLLIFLCKKHNIVYDRQKMFIQNNDVPIAYIYLRHTQNDSLVNKTTPEKLGEPKHISSNEIKKLFGITI